MRKTIRDNNSTAASGKCADVAIQYTIDVLREVKIDKTITGTIVNFQLKIQELQSLLKQPQS